MRRYYIGPLDKALYDGMCFAQGMAQSYFISSVLKQIEGLTVLLESEELDEPHKRATQVLLEQLEMTFYENMKISSSEGLQSGSKTI